MLKKDEKMTLWTSQNKDRSGLQKFDVEWTEELQKQINLAFSEEVKDQKIQNYNVAQDEVGLAKLF